MARRIDLLNGKITQSLLALALPIMATSMIQLAYNLIDMIWVGRIGVNAISAIGASGMYIWIGEGLILMYKIGAQVLAAQQLGAGNISRARDYVKTVLQTSFLSSVTYALALFVFASSMIGFFDFQSADVIFQAVTYLKIVAWGMVFMSFNFVMTGLLTATGDSKTPFLVNTVGIVINIFLDPLLIFGFDMGVSGAGLATVLSQGIVSLLLLVTMSRDDYLFHDLHLVGKVDLRDFMGIARIGLPTSLQSVGYAAISMILSRYTASFGDSAVAITRVGGGIESISWMTADGFGSALSSFIAQNYGSKKYDRARHGYFQALKITTIWGLGTTMLLVLFPGQLLSVFIHEPGLYPLGIAYLQILGLSQLFMCYELMSSGAFGGYGDTRTPFLVSIILTGARIPLAFLLVALVHNVTGIWWAISLSSLAKGVILVTLFFIRTKKYQYQT